MVDIAVKAVLRFHDGIPLDVRGVAADVIGVFRLALAAGGEGKHGADCQDN